MEFVSIKGTISSTVKVISFSPYLVRFTLSTPEQDYNCIVAKDAFNFVYVAEIDAPISIYGHFNKRHQLVIDKYNIRSRMYA